MRACVLSVLAAISVICWSDEREKRDFLGIIPDPVLELDAETLDKIDADIVRWDELDEIFTAALAERTNLRRGRWEGFPEVFFFRVLLVQTALNGERTCEGRQRCAELDAGAPFDSATSYCSPEACDKQHVETMATCQVILEQDCPELPVLRQKCEELRQSAYGICIATADCQLNCCNRSCSGVNCARWATGEQVQPCTNC